MQVAGPVAEHQRRREIDRAQDDALRLGHVDHDGSLGFQHQDRTVTEALVAPERKCEFDTGRCRESATAAAGVVGIEPHSLDETALIKRVDLLANRRVAHPSDDYTDDVHDLIFASPVAWRAVISSVPGTTTMPGEYEPHERTLMCWPTRMEIWGPYRRQAEIDYAEIARTIGRFEPVTMIANRLDVARAADLCGSSVDIVPIAIDDSWARDTGPIFVRDGNGVRSVVDFAFNAWGEKFHPFHDDGLLAGRWAARAAVPVIDVAMVFEGGAVAVDGAGTALTTEQCLLHPNRNPGMTRNEIENELRRHLGIETLVWLPFGLSLDDDTDGHVDNVAAFVRPGHVLVQGCADSSEPDHVRLEIDRRCVERMPDARGEPLTATVVPVLPFVEVDGERLCVPYLNLYVGNGFVAVPVSGHRKDDEMLAMIGEQWPERQVVPVPGVTLAYGGGGPHCITQQVPVH